MTKDEFTKALESAVGSTAYGAEIVADLSEHFGDEGKYAQNAKDRLDERLATLKGWEKKHEAEGEYAKAADEAEKIAIVLKAMAALA